MALVLDDFIKETSTTTGTGTYDLAGAVTGFQTFVAGVGNGNTCDYSATNGTDWETGIGTVTDASPDTLARTTIQTSSNGDAAVNWGAGTKTIICTLITKRFVYAPDVQTFTGSGTWTKPTKGSMAYIQCWGAGGSGGKGAANAPEGGGGGGAYVERWMALSSLGATETVTIGAGGAAQTTGSTAGNVGGNTTFGAHVTAYGGGGGGVSAAGGGGGGGGGALSAGATAAGTVGGLGGRPYGASDGTTTNFANFGGGTGGGGSVVGSSGLASGFDGGWGGGGGGRGEDFAGDGINKGGSSVYGGGGGGGAANSVAGGAGGTSVFGGAGSAGVIDANASSAGTQPGGGSGGTEGGNSGIGGAGQCIVTVF